MKTTLALAALFIIVLGGGYAYNTYQNPTVQQTTVTDAGVSTTTTTVTTSTTTAPVTTHATPIPSGYTAAQVATHNTSSNCWTSIDGNVYNLTAWIGTHPGGESAIIRLCGKDGSSAFDGQHGNDGRAKQMLATFIVGPLMQ